MGRSVQGERIRRLLDGCLRNEFSLVLDLLDEDEVPVDSHDGDDVTPLQAAAAGGHVGLVCRARYKSESRLGSQVEQLLRRGADTELCNQAGLTPILHACYHGHVRVVELLLKSGANPHMQTYLGIDGLTLAARSGSVSLISLLTDFGVGAKPAGVDGSELRLNALSAAVLRNQSGAIDAVLTRDASSIDARVATDMTPLMIAALFSHAATVQSLLTAGADANAVSDDGRTALDYAADADRREIQSVLEPLTAIHVPQLPRERHMDIIEVVKLGDAQQLKEVLAANDGQANALSAEDGTTALIHAAMLGRLDFVTALVAAGAELDRQDKFTGWTALMQAVCHGKIPVAKYLVYAGADVSVRSFSGYSAFDLAAAIDGTDKDLLKLLANRLANRRSNKNPASSRTRSASTGCWKQLANKLRMMRLRSNSQTSAEPEKVFFSLSWAPESSLFVDSFEASGRPFITCNQLLQADTAATAESQSASCQFDALSVLSAQQFSSCASLASDRSAVDCLSSASPFDAAADDELDDDASLSAFPYSATADGEASAAVQMGFSAPCLAVRNAIKMGAGRAKAAPVDAESRPTARPVHQRRTRPASLAAWSHTGSTLANRKRARDGGHQLLRPHSCHDILWANQSSSSSGLGTLPRRQAVAATARRRPFSYHEPLTPTRKAFGGFSNSAGLGNNLSPRRPLTKFSSSPHLSDGSTAAGRTQLLTSSHSRLPTLCSRVSPKRSQHANPGDLHSILVRLSLEQYASVFANNEIETDTFLLLSDADLCEIGVGDAAERSRLLAAADELKRAQTH